MTRIRVTKTFDFEMAHALWNYDGACRNIHGHSYRLFVTVTGIPNPNENDPKFGMVIDFKDLKNIVKDSIINHLDHALVLYENAGEGNVKALKSMYEKVHLFEFQPTCENLVIYIAQKLTNLLPQSSMLHSLKLYETATSFAEWYAEDNK